jgi:hypothetical protein
VSEHDNRLQSLVERYNTDIKYLQLMLSAATTERDARTAERDLLTVENSRYRAALLAIMERGDTDHSAKSMYWLADAALLGKEGGA